jgi:hypothetical protein
MLLQNWSSAAAFFLNKKIESDSIFLKQNDFKMIRNIVLASVFLFWVECLFSQTLTQNIRGTVTDKDTRQPLQGASVVLTNFDPQRGTVTDSAGNFRLDKVPLGRLNIKCTYLGYNDLFFDNLELTSGKELILNFTLDENVISLNTTLIIGRKDKSKTINSTISVSGRTFSIEESQRYAGSRGDVARMAQNFAGVQGADDSRNDIIVRGNSPMGVLYRLEGVDIPNPNHFSSSGTTGGPVSMLNNNVLENSDFISGAFPAEYANAVAAVFDISLRKGNNEKHEFLGQIGFAGFELMAEGPLSKKSKASYLVDYRYSALGIFKLLGFDFGTGTAIPNYQDLNFHLYMPDKKGSWSFFGMGGRSNITINQSEQAGENLFRNEPEDLTYATSTGVIGLNRIQKISKRAFAKIILATDVATVKTILDTFRFDSDKVVEMAPVYRNRSYEGKVSLNAFVQYKINPQNTIKTGFRIYHHFFSLKDSLFRSDLGFWVEPTSFKGSTQTMHIYSTLTHKFGTRLTSNTGLNYSRFFYNGSFSIEPRIGFNYRINKSSTLSLGYGLYSQLSPFRVYFEKWVDSANIPRKINQKLAYYKSYHLVLALDKKIGSNTRIKLETYYQQLFDVPIDGKQEYYYSLLNQGLDFGVAFTDSLVNKGKGRNYGIELTIERFLSKGFYFLNTLSLYRSFYTDALGKEHSTAFDARYALNLLAGKEFYFKVIPSKKEKKKSLTIDARFMLNGGRRNTPIDEEQSKLEQETRYDLTRINSQQFKDYIRSDLRIAYKQQGKRLTQEWGVDIQNLTNRKNIFQRIYDPQTNTYKTVYQTGILPVGLYRVTF